MEFILHGGSQKFPKFVLVRKMPRRRHAIIQEPDSEADDAARIVLRPKEKEEKQNILEYLQYFKRIMNVNGWRDDGKTGEIFAALCGPKERRLLELDGKWKTFSELEALILAQQLPLREAYLASLMQSRLGTESKESIIAKRDEIQFLVSIVYHDFDAAQQQRLVRDFLLWSMPEKVREKLMTGRPTTAEDVISMAAVCLDSCNIGNTTGVRVGSLAAATLGDNVDNVQVRQSRPIQCFYCKKWGHISKNCFKKQRAESGNVNALHERGNVQWPQSISPQ